MWYKMNDIHLDIVCIFQNIAPDFDYSERYNFVDLHFWMFIQGFGIYCCSIRAKYSWGLSSSKAIVPCRRAAL